MWCQRCKALQITPEDKIYKLAKHKKIELKNKKTIHLLHFNEREAARASNEVALERNAFQATAVDDFASSSRPSSAPQTEQPRAVTFLREPDSIDSAASQSSNNNNKNNKNNKTIKYNYLKSIGEISVHLKSDATAASELEKPLESYETFSKLLQSSRFKPTFRQGLDCLDGDKTLGCSVYFRRKIKIDPFDLVKTTTNNDDSNAHHDYDDHRNQLPLLFYIHGVGGSSAIWRNQLEFFGERGYEIIAMDLVGHGQSSAPEQPHMYSFVEIAADILQVFDLFAHRNGQNVAIGHSYGSSFATYLAQYRKELISKLVLISGGAPYPLEYQSALLSAPLCCIRMFKPLFNLRFYW